MSDNPTKPKRNVSEEQLVEIARLAYELDSDSGPCDHQQAKDCEYGNYPLTSSRTYGILFLP